MKKTFKILIISFFYCNISSADFNDLKIDLNTSEKITEKIFHLQINKIINYF